MSEGHARLGPSNKRWPKCPGSPQEESRYPDIPGEAAIDGTGSHLLLEMCLINNVPAAQYDQQIIGVNHHDSPNGWLVAPDRIKRVQMCLDYVIRRVNELKESFPESEVTVEAEQKSDPGGAFGRDDWWGTVDITIIVRQGDTVHFVEVIDYKDGRGYVTEKNNTQLISYLFGKMRPHIASGPDLVRPFVPYKIWGCRMTIVQPKTNPVIRYQCSTQPDQHVAPADIAKVAEKLALAAHETDNPNAELIPGKHCQWCKANPKRGGHCTAQSNQSLQVVENMSNTELVTGNQSLFETIAKVLADPKSLTEAELAEFADAEDGLLTVFDTVKKEIQSRIEQGITVTGYAMVPGRGSNVWAMDEETVVKKLKSRRLKQADIFPAKLISPAACLKLSKLTDDQKKRIETDLITFKAGKLGLKKVAHDHQAIKNVSDTEMMFADVPKPEEVSFF